MYDKVLDNTTLRIRLTNMRNVIPLRPIDGAEPKGLHDRALEDLSFIRATMERATAFTLVPGLGGVGMGVTALLAAWLASRQVTEAAWLAVWLRAAAVALAIGVAGLVWKARRSGVAIPLRPARRFALGFVPPLLVGALLTAALVRAGPVELLPGVWLLTYGMAVVAGGAFSVRVVPLMGAGLLACGALALFTPPAWGDAWMAGGFGVMQILFGSMIAQRYGG